MSRNIAIVALVGLLSIAISGLISASAEEIDKKPIVEQWRKEIQPLKEAYSNVQISGSQMVDKNFDGDDLEFFSSFSYVRRGPLKRLDITNGDPKKRLNESWVIGTTEAYTIFRDDEDKPFTLRKRSFEKNVAEYERVLNLTPYTNIRMDIVAGRGTNLNTSIWHGGPRIHRSG